MSTPGGNSTTHESGGRSPSDQAHGERPQDEELQADHHDTDGQDHSEHADHSGHSDHAAMFRDRFWLTLVLTVPVVIWAEHVQMLLGYTAPAFPGEALIRPVLGTVVLLYGGWPFLTGGWSELRSRQPGMIHRAGRGADERLDGRGGAQCAAVAAGVDPAGVSARAVNAPPYRRNGTQRRLDRLRVPLLRNDFDGAARCVETTPLVRHVASKQRAGPDSLRRPGAPAGA